MVKRKRKQIKLTDEDETIEMDGPAIKPAKEKKKEEATDAEISVTPRENTTPSRKELAERLERLKKFEAAEKREIEAESREDGHKTMLFAGVIIGIVIIAAIILVAFGGEFSPLNVIGSLLVIGNESQTTNQTPIAPVVVPPNESVSTERQEPEPEVKVESVNLTVKRWTFNPSEITVEKGTRVRMTVSSLDLTYTFKIEGYGIKEKLPRKDSISLDFIANETGEYQIEASATVPQFASIRGKLIVEDIKS